MELSIVKLASYLAVEELHMAFEIVTTNKLESKVCNKIAVVQTSVSHKVVEQRKVEPFSSM